MTALELWDDVVDGKSLFDARHDADYGTRLVHAIDGWQRRYSFCSAWIGGGETWTVENDLAQSKVPIFVSSLGQWIAGPGGLALAGTPHALVVDVGQTGIKLMWRHGRMRVDRPRAPDLRRFIGGAIESARARCGTIDAVVLALPCELDDALVPGPSSYPAMEGDATLVEDVLVAAKLEGVPALVLNDAELAAVTAQRELQQFPSLVLTLGHGVGAALVYARGMSLESSRPSTSPSAQGRLESSRPSTSPSAQGRLDDEARAFAVERHGEQRYGQFPYVVHLEAVRQVLREFGHEGPLGIAAWLHDVVEDTATTRDEVAARFGDEVAALVWAVTGVGDDRKARTRAAYDKIRAYPAAATLKLADRIANVEASSAVPRKLDMYRGEWEGFAAALAGLGDARMWERLRRGLGVGA